MAYTQAEVNSALSNLLASDPNASYQNVITAAGNYGITPEQVNAAYSANLPGMTREQGLAALNQTMNQPLSWTPFDMPGNDGLTSGDILGYTSTGQGVRNVYGDPYWYAEGDNAEYRRDPIGYSASLTNPMKLGTGEYGYYEGIYDPQGNLQDIQWQKAEEHKGWFGENLDWIAPLLITGGAYGLNALAGAAGAGAGAASAVAGVEGVASQAALTAYESAIAAGATQAAALAAADSAAAQAATALNLGADTVSFDPGGLNTGADTLTSATVDGATTGTTDLAANAVGGVEGQASQFATSAYQDAIASGLTEQQALLAADTASALAGSGLSYADALSSALETATSGQATGWVTGANEVAGAGGQLAIDAGVGATGSTSLFDRLVAKVGETEAGKLIKGLANGTVSELEISTILKGASQIFGVGSIAGALLDSGGEGENKTLPVNDQGLANLITPYSFTRQRAAVNPVTSQSALDYLMGKAPAAGTPATTSARDWFTERYTAFPSYNPVTSEAITGTPTTTKPNITPSQYAAVANMYDAIGRSPDVTPGATGITGADYWAQQLASGKSLEQVQQEFNASAAVVINRENVIDNFYRALGRDADPEGRSYWLQEIDRMTTAGVPEQQALERVRQEFSNSAATVLDADPTAISEQIATAVPLSTAIATEADAISEYNRLLNAGYSDAEIRAAADQIYGTQTDTNWTYLQSKASDTNVPAENTVTTTQETPSTDQMIQDAYASIGRTGFGGATSQIDQDGFNYWKSEIESGRIAPDDFRSVFDTAVQNYVSTAAADDPYVAQIRALRGANGGLMALNMAMGGGVGHLGGYSDGGRLLRGPGDGVSDSIPATIGNKQPAQLADGEFVIPARIVSELGNGSTEAGARQLYAMMDRIQKSRRKSIGKGKVAVDAQARKHLPA